MRVIQEREFTLLAVTIQPFSANFNSLINLGEAVERGEFREDLYYRLNVIPRLPPLRDRGEDCNILADHFLQCFGKQEEKPLGCLVRMPGVYSSIQLAGNIRQLENLVHSLVVLTDQRVIDRPYFKRTRNRFQS